MHSGAILRSALQYNKIAVAPSAGTPASGPATAPLVLTVPPGYQRGIMLSDWCEVTGVKDFSLHIVYAGSGIVGTCQLMGSNLGGNDPGVSLASELPDDIAPIIKSFNWTGGGQFMFAVPLRGFRYVALQTVLQLGSVTLTQAFVEGGGT